LDEQDEGEDEKGATEPVGDNHSAHEARDDFAQTKKAKIKSPVQPIVNIASDRGFVFVQAVVEMKEGDQLLLDYGE
jgi:hypothetical protein